MSLKYKIISSIAIIFLLNACSITSALWRTTTSDDKISGFFIDKTTNKIILVGEEVYKDKGNWHYTVENSQNNLTEVFALGTKYGKDFWINIDQAELRGSELYGRKFAIGFSLKSTLTKQQEAEFLAIAKSNYATKNNKIIFSFENFDKDTQSQKIITRYLATNETYKNFDKEIVKFAQPWSGEISNKHSALGNTGRVIATPYTILIDIIISPYSAYKFFTKKEGEVEKKKGGLYD